MAGKKFTNALARTHSAYLLQHAHNPVDWHPWDEAVLERAAASNKLLIISIGYASCHWCHVMEKEVFDNQEVALYMNAHFLAIKVDREERPDIDQVYMEALQVLTQSGGWPLNIVALPDGRPLWGCTYLPKQEWLQSLKKIYALQKENPQRLFDYGEQLMQQLSLELTPTKNNSKSIDLELLQKKLLLNQDTSYGGFLPPKFMMPVLLHAFQLLGGRDKNNPFFQQWAKTLEKMALGGIHDLVGGGIARYAVDAYWHIPHFEKMAYDNGQLLSSYSIAYRRDPKPLYKETLESIIRFIEEELSAPEGRFYSAIDADSPNKQGEKEEGAYYVWTQKELASTITDHQALFMDYYNINSFGYWEDDKYVLIRKQDATSFAKANQIPLAAFEQLNRQWLIQLQKVRQLRTPPFKDQKVILSWNALISKGLLDAYRSLGVDALCDRALKNLNYLFAHYVESGGKTYRIVHPDGQKISGFLEDYAALIASCIYAYETVFDPIWLKRAENLTHYCLSHFKAHNSPFFYFTATQDHSLIVRKKETEDNVIPSSNALMAENLYRLAIHLDAPRWKKQALAMLDGMQEKIEDYPKAYGQWLQLYWKHQKGMNELVVVGKDYKNIMAQLHQMELPNTVLAAAATETDLPLLRNRFQKNKTLIYWCQNNRCLQPVETLDKIHDQLNT